MKMRRGEASIGVNNVIVYVQANKSRYFVVIRKHFHIYTECIQRKLYCSVLSVHSTE